MILFSQDWCRKTQTKNLNLFYIHTNTHTEKDNNKEENETYDKEKTCSFHLRNIFNSIQSGQNLK